MTLEAGQQLLHYRLIKKIGEGGMGEVYEAEDTRLNRPVALKVLAPRLVGDPRLLERFRREAQAVAATSHPNIVTVYSVEEDDEIHFITMELVRGRSLNRLIPDGGLELERLFDVAIPVADALAAAHAAGITHRDLKPSNVMLGDDDRVRILDFGLAKIDAPATPDPEATRTKALTNPGTVMGTAPYMSPEQIEGRAVDDRTDIFSLGVMLHEMATGQRPFTSDTSAGLVSAILRDTPSVVSDVREDMPRHLGRIVSRCLEKAPRDRYQTARDVFNELRALKREIQRETGTTDSGSAVDSVVTRRGTAAASRRIAVLPFANSSGDAEIDAFAHGIAEDVATGLDQFAYLSVVAEQSTRRYGGQNVDARSVGDELGARYIVEGGIRKAGTALRINVQLVDATTGARMWSERYDRDIGTHGIFEVQDDVTDRVVATIADAGGVLMRALVKPLLNRSPESLDPDEALVRAYTYSYSLSAADHLEVRTALECAVDGAPRDADLLGLLAILCVDEYQHEMNLRPNALALAAEYARRAVAADPSSQIAFQGLAFMHFARRDPSGFRAAVGRVLALNRRSTLVLAHIGMLTAYLGEWERGLGLIERAIELNPIHPDWYYFVPYSNHLRKREYPEALNVALKINMPDLYHTHTALAAAHAYLGNARAAREALAEVERLYPDYGANARRILGKWYSDDVIQVYVEGLEMAGLQIPPADEAES